MITEYGEGKIAIHYPEKRIRNEKYAAVALFILLSGLTLWLVETTEKRFMFLVLFAYLLMVTIAILFSLHRLRLTRSYFIVDETGIIYHRPHNSETKILWDEVIYIEDDQITGAFVVTDINNRSIKIYCSEHRGPFLDAREMTLKYLSQRFGGERLSIDAITEHLMSLPFQEKSGEAEKGSDSSLKSRMDVGSDGRIGEKANDNSCLMGNSSDRHSVLHAQPIHPLILIVTMLILILTVAVTWDRFAYDLTHPFESAPGIRGNWLWYLPLLFGLFLIQIRRVEIRSAGLLLIYPLWSKRIYFANLKEIEIRSQTIENGRIGDRIVLVIQDNKTVKLPKIAEGDDMAVNEIRKAFDAYRAREGRL